MTPFSIIVLASGVAFALVLSFHCGRFYERSFWSPGPGLHLIGKSNDERYWIVRYADPLELPGDTELVGWTKLSPRQRDEVLRREGPPKSIGQARRFLFEVGPDGALSVSMGPTEESERYEISFEREGGYDPV